MMRTLGDLRQEVEDFVQFLLEKRARKLAGSYARIGREHCAIFAIGTPHWSCRRKLWNGEAIEGCI